jgi:hypothetical protein
MTRARLFYDPLQLDSQNVRAAERLGDQEGLVDELVGGAQELDLDQPLAERREGQERLQAGDSSAGDHDAHPPSLPRLHSIDPNPAIPRSRRVACRRVPSTRGRPPDPC